MKDDVLQAVIAGAKANGSWYARYGEVSIKEALAPTSTQCEVQPNLDQGPDYERGFVDGMLYQTQTSVDKAVNAMAQPEQEPSITKEARGTLILHSGWDDLPNGTKFYTTPPKRPWVGLTDEKIAYAYTLEKKFAMQYVDAKLKEKNT